MRDVVIAYCVHSLYILPLDSVLLHSVFISCMVAPIFVEKKQDSEPKLAFSGIITFCPKPAFSLPLLGMMSLYSFPELSVSIFLCSTFHSVTCTFLKSLIFTVIILYLLGMQRAILNVLVFLLELLFFFLFMLWLQNSTGNCKVRSGFTIFFCLLFLMFNVF